MANWYISLLFNSTECLKLMCTLFETLFLSNETRLVQFLLCMIQKAQKKHSNRFIVLHVFKQTWRWNYHSMKVSSYWSVIEEWRMLLSSTPLEGWNRYTTANKSNSNKDPRQVWSWWNGARCVERSVRRKEKFHWQWDCCCSHAGFARSPKKSLRQCSREIVSRNPVFI